MQEYKPFKSGKVREMYDVGDSIIMVATDRISAFDHILKNMIVKKGTVLTQISKFWFDLTKDIVPNHMISVDTKDMPEFFQKPEFTGNSMKCKKLNMLPIECIVRGYITGSGWASYQKTGKVCGIQLPEGLKESEKLPEPIYTPSTKAEIGDHDENISYEQSIDVLEKQFPGHGLEYATKLRDYTIALYKKCAEYALSRGIIIADTKFEFGLDENISFYRHMFDLHDGKPKRKVPTVNVTIQNTISAKALDTWNHAFGSTIGGENSTFMRNLWADNTGRNPSIGWGGVFNFVNNIIYNWVHRTADGGEFSTMSNFINNYYKPGPLTPKGAISYRIVKSESRSNKLFPWAQYGRIYAEGNIVEGNEAVTKDNWNGGIQIADKDLPNGIPADVKALMRSNEPFAMPHMTIIPKDQTFDKVLENVGATIPSRDIVDQRIVEEVRTGQAYYVKKLPKKNPYGDFWGLADKSKAEDGSFKYRRLDKDSYKLCIITDICQVGGFPKYKTVKPYVDTDGDGMPDEWEIANGLNPNDPSDANKDCTGDGYTNIEKYINGISTKEKVDWTDMKNNHDTLAEKGKLL